ncbi:MAG: hypothetical protein Kapaf2KO_00640 [Candidatus Kapaibacteriales bacterium]
MLPLKGHDCFSEHFKAGVRLRKGPLSISYLMMGDNAKRDKNLVKHGNHEGRSAKIKTSDHVILFGVTASKRNNPKANVRNRIKRLQREALRAAVEDLRQYDNYYEALTEIDSLVLFWNKRLEKASLIGLSDILRPTTYILRNICEKIIYDKNP